MLTTSAMERLGRARSQAKTAVSKILAGAIFISLSSVVQENFHAATFVARSFRNTRRDQLERRRRVVSCADGAYLSIEERKGNMRMKPRNKKRRGKIWAREMIDGSYELVEEKKKTEQPLPSPSDDPSMLLKQIADTRHPLRLCTFMESAAHSPAFTVEHGVKALDVLSRQRQELTKENRNQIASHPGLEVLVERMEELLAQAALAREKGAEEESLGPRLTTIALRAIATCRDDVSVPHRLVVPLASEAALAASDMSNQEVAVSVWAISRLKELTLLLQDNLLPLMVQNNRLLGVREYCKQKARYEYTLLKQAIMTLRRDVPYLRQFLPMW